MTHKEAICRRLRNQCIVGSDVQRPVDVVERLVAVQAQDFEGTKWGLGLRLRGVKEADVQRAFDEGEILRTHLLRPTWHFVSPADIRWLLTLTGPRIHVVNAHRYRQLELDVDTLKRSGNELAKALESGRYLTRRELRDTLDRVGILTDGQRLAHIMMFAELEAIVCSGPRRGKQFTYALFDERVPAGAVPDREESLAALANRYFVSRGPATLHDFAKWSGLTMGDARSGLETVKAQLRAVTMDGRTFWHSGSELPGRAGRPVARLMSIYDEYMSSYRDRSAIVHPEHDDELRARGAAPTNILLLDGRIAGTWRRTFRKNAAVIDTNLFRRATDSQRRAIRAEVRRYGAFYGLAATSE